MEDVCKRNCHECLLQETISDKITCATLLMPAMINEVASQYYRLTELISDLKLSENKPKSQPTVKKISLKKEIQPESDVDDE